MKLPYVQSLSSVGYLDPVAAPEQMMFAVSGLVRFVPPVIQIFACVLSELILARAEESFDFSLALDILTNTMATRIPMIATTIKSSISVKPSQFPFISPHLLSIVFVFVFS
jgi:hypothetical protein